MNKNNRRQLPNSWVLRKIDNSLCFIGPEDEVDLACPGGIPENAYSTTIPELFGRKRVIVIPGVQMAQPSRRYPGAQANMDDPAWTYNFHLGSNRRMINKDKIDRMAAFIRSGDRPHNVGRRFPPQPSIPKWLLIKTILGMVGGLLILIYFVWPMFKYVLPHFRRLFW